MGKFSAIESLGFNCNKYDTKDLRDNKKNYLGIEAKKIISNINSVIAPWLQGESVKD